jgi:hypothetical protein
MNQNEWITIKTFWQVHEAEMVKNFLLANDIENRVKDDFTLQSDPMLNNAIGGAKLQVKAEQFEQAYSLLKSKNIITNKDHVDNSFYNKIEKFLRKYLNL